MKLEYWQSQEGPRRALCKFAGALFNTYAKKYERPASCSKKDMANVQK